MVAVSEGFEGSMSKHFPRLDSGSSAAHELETLLLAAKTVGDAPNFKPPLKGFCRMTAGLHAAGRISPAALCFFKKRSPLQASGVREEPTPVRRNGGPQVFEIREKVCWL